MRALAPPPPDRADGWCIEGQLLECFPFDSCAESGLALHTFLTERGEVP